MKRLPQLLTCLVLLLAAVLLAPPADAKTLTWAADADINSLDPHARDETFTLGFLNNVYEGLVARGPKMEILPALAVKWEIAEPKRWRVYLRKGVKFAEGEPFTADDVIFSVKRSLSPGSGMKSSKLPYVVGAQKVDDYTVDFLLSAPNPILTSSWGNWFIMSKSWAEKNGIKEVPTLEEITKSAAATMANGTGPFKITKRQTDSVTEAVPNPNWWGTPKHNIDKVVFRPIGSAATRTAALLSGDIDVAIPVAPQDQARVQKAPKTKLLTGPELRTCFIGFDVGSNELVDADVKGKNPFKDRRVRLAFYQAIDVEAIHSKVMLGQSTPTAAIISPSFNAFPKHLKRYPYDPAAAKKLLAEAGYPNGFTLTMECPNDRYVNDERICTAVAGMLGKIGVKVRVFAMPKSQFFPRVQSPSHSVSLWYMGLSSANMDAAGTLEELAHTRVGNWGNWNGGKLSDEIIDRATEAAMTESDKPKRDALLKTAQDRIHDQVYFIPVHQQALSWGVRDTITLIQRADNVFEWKYVTIK
jgi:peptide/nickel transport system substrate-binding protein